MSDDTYSHSRLNRTSLRLPGEKEEFFSHPPEITRKNGKSIKPSEIPVFGSKPTAKTASAVGKNKLTLQQRVEIINGIRK